MITEIECQKIADIAINAINKHSEKWNKATIVTGYCHNEYNGCSLSYNDAKSITISYWGEKYSDLPDNEMYSFEGYDYVNEILKKHYTSCQNDPNLRWNMGKITIYPSGEYESVFIWDEEADLDYLATRVRLLFDYIHEEMFFKIPNLLVGASSSWEKAIITMPFKEGQIQPLNLEITCMGAIIHQTLLIQNVTYEESPNLIDQFSNIYQLTNEGKLKGTFVEKWNIIVFHIYADADFDFGKDVKFEWREENV